MILSPRSPVFVPCLHDCPRGGTGTMVLMASAGRSIVGIASYPAAFNTLLMAEPMLVPSNAV